ncbi:MAG: flavodoxin [Planctomycetia bacterium]|nr:flavodoxin [Planctomycetia bacterium]
MSESQSAKKILVVYFSHSGNTRTMAQQIQKATNGDLFEIVTVDKYPRDYDAVVAQAKKEQEANYRPALKTKCDNINDYDVVFVGSPSWWGTVGMAVMTFLESVDLSGKTVVPFMTHEGSGLGRTVADLKKLCPESNFLTGHAIFGSRIKSSESQVVSWLRQIGIVS